MIVEITEYDRPRRLVTTTRLARMDITSDLRFEPGGSSTRLRWTSHLRPRGWLRLVAPIIAAFGHRQTNAIWTGLRDTLEHRTNEVAR